MTAALEGGEWSAARPGPTLPPGKTRYPFCRRLGGQDGRVENLVPTGIRSRTVQAVAQSLYRLSYRAHVTRVSGIRKSARKRLDVLQYHNGDTEVLENKQLLHNFKHGRNTHTYIILI